jgi:thiol-disulfide isomerase/thioredoxin
MKVKQIGDWTLEDRLAAGGPPVVVMFLKAEGRADRLRKANLRLVAEEHPEASFYEVDLIENPSLQKKYSILIPPTVVVFVDGAEVARHGGPFIGPMILRVLGPCPTDGDEA